MVRAFDTKSGEYFFKIDIGLPIRALDVFVNLPIVVFGTIEGSLYFANYEEDHEPSFIEHLDSCITCIRTNGI